MSSGTVTLANLKLQGSDNVAFVDFSSATALKLYDGHRLVMRDSSGKRKMGCVHYNASDTPFVNLTYASAGSSGITVADNDNLDYGTGNFFGGVLASLPDYTPSAEVILDHKHDGANGRIFSVQTNGKLRLTINGTNYDSTVATGLTDGTQHFLSYSVTRETATVAGSILFGVDGVTLGTSVSITAGAPATVSNASSQYIMGTSAIRSACAVIKFYSYNRALSAAEVLSLYQSGVATADQWGSQTAKYTSDFSAGDDGWTASQGAVSGNIDSIGGLNDWLRFTVNNVNGLHYIKKSYPAALTVGKKYRLSFKYYIPSTNSNLVKIDVYIGDNQEISEYLTTLDAATSYSIEFTLASSQTQYRIWCAATELTFQDAGGDDVFYIKDFVVTQIGATLDLEPAGIGAASWTDSSSNGLNASYPAAGFSPYPVGNGVRITSVSGGATYSWEGTDLGFNTEDASGYTYTLDPHTGFKRTRGIRRYRDANGVERIIYY